MSIVRVSAAWLGSLFLVASTALAQPAPGPGGGGGGMPPGGGAANVSGAGGVGFVAKHKEEQLAAIRDQLEVADDGAWEALASKVERVIVAKQNTNTGAGMQWTRSTNAPPTFRPSAATPDTAPGRAMQDVRDAVADKDAPDEELARRLAAVREARQAARAEYEAAQKELLDALTPRQQAILMTLGVVE